MKEKNLPIKIFEKRKEVDERQTEGGGSDKEPSWVKNQEILENKANIFSEELNQILQYLEKREKVRDFIPALLNVTIIDDATAKTHRQEIHKLFNKEHEESNLIGLQNDRKLIVKIKDKETIEFVKGNLKKTDKFKRAISAIDEIERFKPFIKLPDNKNKSLKVKLINFQDIDINKFIRKDFETICEKNKIFFKKTKYAKELIIYKIEKYNKAKVDEIARYEALFSIEEMPEIDIDIEKTKNELNINIKEPKSGEDYPTIGILDSGIENVKYLKPWILTDNYTGHPENYVDRGHGTFVAGIINYGNELLNSDETALPTFLYDAIIFPAKRNNTMPEDELILNIEEGINSNKKIKIWNLSIGGIDEAYVDKFSDFGISLDEIQDKYGILIVKSAGNCKNFRLNRPKGRISQSADSVRSLVVGSIAHDKGKYDLVDKFDPSPFTRIGPGPSFIIKPDIVHFGGNVGMNNGKEIQNGVSSFSTDGSIIKKIGTSFSTPRISSIAAGIHHNLAEGFDPLLIKGMIIHSANYPKNSLDNIEDKINQMGFGLPASIENILYNDPYEITLILQDTLEKGSFIEILDFPFPEELTEDGYYYGGLTVTLVNNPILRATQGAEYCQSNINIYLGTYDMLKKRTSKKPSLIKNPIGKEGGENLLRGALYLNNILEDNDDENIRYTNEKLLINYGKKFHPIKKYSLNLEDMKISSKEKYLKYPKNWFLKVEGLFRNFIENSAIKTGEDLSQDFVILITIKDTKRKINVYDKVSQLLQQYNFIHRNVKLRADIKIPIRG